MNQARKFSLIHGEEQVADTPSYEIARFFKSYWDTLLRFHSDDVLNQLEWNDFIRLVSTMNIKTSGTKIEARILKLNDWKKIRGHSSHGDAISTDGKVIEVKSSIISPIRGSGVTFRGIRPWHNVDEYHFVLVDLSKYAEIPKTHTFKLSKQQINHEHNVERTLRPYNMKNDDRALNEKIELGTSFRKSDLERWVKLYSSEIKL